MPMQNSLHLNWLRLLKMFSSEGMSLSERGIFRPRMYLTWLSAMVIEAPVIKPEMTLAERNWMSQPMRSTPMAR